MAQTFTGRFVRSRGFGQYARTAPWCEGDGELAIEDAGLVIRGTRRGWRATTHVLVVVALVAASVAIAKLAPVARSTANVVGGLAVVLPYVAFAVGGAFRRVADEQRVAWRSVRGPVVAGSGEVVARIGWLWAYRLRFAPATDPHALIAALRR